MSARILIQIDADDQPSSFDSVVAIDAGVDHLLRYSRVGPTDVTGLVHGAMFTRGPESLRHTAIFIGGSEVSASEELFRAAADCFFGPLRVSLMLDAGGCNTTAAAAVVTAGQHQSLAGARAVVLGGTGPVGRRVTQLLAGESAAVTVTSRTQSRAGEVCQGVLQAIPSADVTPVSVSSPKTLRDVLQGAQILIACGAAGVELVDRPTLDELETLAVAIDLNAVPPAGIAPISVSDRAKPLAHGVGYGAIGVGGLKMKTHKEAIRRLFAANDQRFDAAEIYEIAKSVAGTTA